MEDETTEPLDTVEVRNAYYTENGNINCEWNHPERGWIPYTVSKTPDTPEMQQIWDHLQTQEVAPYSPEPPTKSDVNEERQRRLYDGKAFDITGYTSTIRLQGDPNTIQNLNSLALKSNILIAQGNGDQITDYRDADNIIHPINQNQLLELWSKAGAYIEACYKSSWALKDNGPIPNDFLDDAYWP